MENHKPECPSLNACVIEDCLCPKPECICAEIKRAEKRLLLEVGLVLEGISDEMWIAKNANQAFNVKWWIIEKIDEIAGKP